MATIGIYFTAPGKEDYPFSIPAYYDSYQRLSAYCAKQNLRIVYLRAPESHLGGTTFRSGWEFQESGLVEVEGPLTVDLIYNKCVGPTPPTFPHHNILNALELDTICFDKLRTYQEFPDLVIPTFTITRDTWKSVFEKISGTNVLLKPRGGEEGKGIFMTEKATFSPDMLPNNEEYLAQPFIDASAGIPGITTGLHDLRLMVFDGIVRLASLRQPKPGEIVSNTARGASLVTVSIEKIPQEAIEMAAAIDQRFLTFTPRIYTVDLMFDHGAPIVVELNSRPGIPKVVTHGQEHLEEFLHYLTQSFHTAVTHHHE